MKTFYNFFIEKFSDLGKLSPEELKKGQRLDSKDTDNFKQVTGRVFYQALTNISKNDEFRRTVNPQYFKNIKNNLTVYPVSDYQKMKCFLGKNNSSGFCLKDRDELVSVFSSQESSGNAIVQEAIRQGATRLDCFATQNQNGEIENSGLYKLYSRNGFVVDRSMNHGNKGEPYSIQNGISYFVDDSGMVDPSNPTVVIFMKLNK
jgi:hypothetical protein